MLEDHSTCAPSTSQSLEALDELGEKVARVHGNSDPRLHQVRDSWRAAMETVRDLRLEMDQLRALTDEFTVPPNACRSYRALFAGLASWDQRIGRE